jgi:hypothetical protein
MRPNRPVRLRAALALGAAIASAAMPLAAHERVESSLASGVVPERGARVVGTRPLDERSHAALLDALARQAEVNRAVALAARPLEPTLTAPTVIVAPGAPHGGPQAAHRPGCPGCVQHGPRVPKPTR